MDDLWDIARVAAYLGVTERTVYNKVRSGDLAAVKVGRLWRVRESDLQSWLSASAKPRARAAAASAGPYPYPALEAPVAPVSVAEGAAIPSREDLEALLAGIDDVVVRRARFVGLLGRGVEAQGWPAPVLVGGAAVQFHTAGDYATVDIDVVGASEPVAAVLEYWGFARTGRHFYDEGLNLVVEVPGSSLAPAQLAHTVAVRTAGVTAYVIGVEDLIVDRLAACAFWNDAESCRWARALLMGAAEIDEPYLQSRAAEEQVAEKLAELRGETG